MNVQTHVVIHGYNISCCAQELSLSHSVSVHNESILHARIYYFPRCPLNFLSGVIVTVPMIENNRIATKMAKFEMDIFKAAFEVTKNFNVDVVPL